MLSQLTDVGELRPSVRLKLVSKATSAQSDLFKSLWKTIWIDNNKKEPSTTKSCSQHFQSQQHACLITTKNISTLIEELQHNEEAKAIEQNKKWFKQSTKRDNEQHASASRSPNRAQNSLALSSRTRKFNIQWLRVFMHWLTKIRKRTVEQSMLQSYNHGNKHKAETGQKLSTALASFATFRTLQQVSSNASWTTAIQWRCQRTKWTWHHLFPHQTFLSLIKTCLFNHWKCQRQSQLPTAETLETQTC